MSERRKSLVPGILLVLVGVVLLLNQMNLLNFRPRHVLPVAMLAGGALLFMSAFSRTEKGAVFPGSVLMVLGSFFLFRNYRLFDFDYLFYSVGEFWPVILIALGVGFVVLFLFKPGDLAVLVPGGILLFIGSVFMLRNSGYFYWRDLSRIWPVILIAIGVTIVITSLKGKSKDVTEAESPESS